MLKEPWPISLIKWLTYARDLQFFKIGKDPYSTDEETEAQRNRDNPVSSAMT